MYNMREDLGVDCRLIEVLDELLHLWPRVWREKMAAPHQSHSHSGFGCSSADTGHQAASRVQLMRMSSGGKGIWQGLVPAI